MDTLSSPAVRRKLVALALVVPMAALAAVGCSEGGGGSLGPSDNPTPAITSLARDSAAMGEPGFALTVEGTGFVGASVVQWNGADRATTVVSGTRLTAAITTADLASGGTANVRVFNPAPGGGMSNPRVFTIRAPSPAPVASSMSPDAAAAGGAGFTLTVTGTGFAPTSVVRWNNTDRPTRFVNSNQVTAEIPASDIAAAGPALVSVFTPAPGGGLSQPMTFRVSGPTPSITSLSPATVATGSGAFTLTVNGTGFVSGAQVIWSGQGLPTTFVNATQLTALVPAEETQEPRGVLVEVVNPGSSGAYSNEVEFTIADMQSANVTSRITVDLPTNDMIHDPSTGRIYASVPSSGGSRGNTVTSIDPATGQILSSVFVGSEPGKLALSDDGQFLYVALDGAAAVRRFDIASGTAGLQFTLGSDGFHGPMYVEDMEVLPGAPHAIAVSRRYRNLSPQHAGVAIYDDGVQRSTTTPGHTGANAIEFGASASVLYGYNNETTEFGFRTLAVGSSGVTVTNTREGIIEGFGADLVFAGGRIYATTGEVVDPVARQQLGRFGATGSVRPDPANGRVFFLTAASAYSSESLKIQAFELDTFRPIDAAVLPNASGETNGYGRLVRWGSDGLAFRTNARITLIRTTLVRE